MIPKKIRPYLKIEREKRTRGEERIDGRLVCCGNRAFEVFAEGKSGTAYFTGCASFRKMKISRWKPAAKCAESAFRFSTAAATDMTAAIGMQAGKMK